MKTIEAVQITLIYAQTMERDLEPSNDLCMAYMHATAHLLRRDLIDVVPCTGKNNDEEAHFHLAPKPELEPYVQALLAE